MRGPAANKARDGCREVDADRQTDGGSTRSNESRAHSTPIATVTGGITAGGEGFEGGQRGDLVDICVGLEDVVPLLPVCTAPCTVGPRLGGDLQVLLQHKC